MYEVIQFTSKKCFRKFGNQVSDARRTGDIDPSKKIFADTFKLWGNSAYDKTITNKEKHKTVEYLDQEKAVQAINNPLFNSLNPITETLFEVQSFKKKIVFDLPLLTVFFVYGYAKLRMLQFYYDCLLEFVDRKNFECLEWDTDSLYIAISGKSLQKVIKEEKKEEFYKNYHQ